MDMGGSAMPYEELNVLGHRLELDDQLQPKAVREVLS